MTTNFNLDLKLYRTNRIGLLELSFVPGFEFKPSTKHQARCRLSYVSIYATKRFALGFLMLGNVINTVALKVTLTASFTGITYVS